MKKNQITPRQSTARARQRAFGDSLRGLAVKPEWVHHHAGRPYVPYVANRTHTPDGQPRRHTRKELRS